MQFGKNIEDRVIMIVRCYLKAWIDSPLEMKNNFLLEKLVIVKYYKSDPDFEMQIIFAIEIFLSQYKTKENWSSQFIC